MEARPLAPAVLLLPFVLAPLVPAAVGAQEDLWTVSGEVGAAVFFGNTEQTTVTSRVQAALADSAREFTSDAAFNYGQATDQDGDTFVNKRSWEVGLSYDHRPFARWSPFVMSRIESSFEKRIDLRYNVGAGGKYSLITDPARRVDLSLALLAEETRPSDRSPDTESELLARWSARFRARRTVGDDRLVATHETFYRPVVTELEEFTLVSTTSLAFQLNQVISLKVTFVDNYDSEARARGARTNNDGQIFFSVLSAF